ncbi:MAG TPA: DUF4333 domain-containing protein [Leptolyngbyaceae cyanobacterium]
MSTVIHGANARKRVCGGSTSGLFSTGAIALSLTSTFALSACTFTFYLSKASVEEAIQKGYEEQTQIKLTSISCPDEMEATAGKVYQCTGETPDVNLTFAVKPTGEDTNVEWETAQIVLTGAAVEKQLKAGIEEEIEVGLDSITCPSQIIAEAGQVYKCTVTAGEETATVVVEPTGEDTHFNWTLEQSS